MLLRRVIEDVKAQNWTAVAIDFVIVVIGVFMGIQVANWNEARQDRRDAAEFRLRLENDLETELVGWQHGIAYYSVARDHGLAALAGYDDPASQTATEFVVGLYQASQRWNITSQRGTYDELISSGRISLIQDEATRARLANHYLRMKSLQNVLDPIRGEYQYRRLIRLHTPHAIQRAIREACGDTYVVQGTNYFYLELPETCPLELPADIATPAAAALRENAEVQRELRFHVSVLEGQLAAMENAIVIAEKTLAQVRAVPR